jgi:hypothetical protein
MKITVIGENFYQVEEFQKYFRAWVKKCPDNLMISFDCCPISLFMIYYHIKYDDKPELKYIMSTYLPKYYYTNQIGKFLKDNYKKIRKGDMIIFSTYTYITDNEVILEQYNSIKNEYLNPEREGRDIRDIRYEMNLDEIDKALINNCEMIKQFLNLYKSIEKKNWTIYNDLQKQSSIVMGQFTKKFKKYHLLIYTNFINSYLGNINNIEYKSMLSYWNNIFQIDIIYLLAKEGDIIDIRTNIKEPLQYKEKYFTYDKLFLPFIMKSNINHVIFKKIFVADNIYNE